MMGRRINRYLARWRIDADASFKRFDHLHSVDALGLLHAVGPKVETLVGPHREFGHVRIVRAKALVKLLKESGVGWVFDTLEIVVTNQHTVGLFGRQHDLFVADAESR